MFPCCQQKRVFVEPFVNLNDPIEIDLLYHQSVSDVFDQKIPLTKADAVRMNCISVCSRQIGLQSNTSTLIPELQPHGRRRLDLECSDLSVERVPHKFRAPHSEQYFSLVPDQTFLQVRSQIGYYTTCNKTN